MFFIISNIFAVLMILFLLYILSAVWPPDSPWAPWWQMPEDVCKRIARLAKVNKKDTIYDLGCGTGRALIIANTLYGARGIGIEIDPLRAMLAKINVWKNQVKDVTILKDNFYDINLSDATILYIYLVPNALRRLTKKLLAELKPGTKIVSYIYDLPETYKGKVKLLHHDKTNKIFVYLLSKTEK